MCEKLLLSLQKEKKHYGQIISWQQRHCRTSRHTYLPQNRPNMKNIYFPDEDITENDLFFVCSMIERVARHIKQRNKYVVNRIG